MYNFEKLKKLRKKRSYKKIRELTVFLNVIFGSFYMEKGNYLMNILF